ncbi:MAG: hypothetical protein Q7K42_06210, partial [Candidatus Diapherotrites archaeon]|nr:hypothetical protein [Candidatus Diapherotrites archaeon]
SKIMKWFLEEHKKRTPLIVKEKEEAYRFTADFTEKILKAFGLRGEIITAINSLPTQKQRFEAFEEILIETTKERPGTPEEKEHEEINKGVKGILEKDFGIIVKSRQPGTKRVVSIPIVKNQRTPNLKKTPETKKALELEKSSQVAAREKLIEKILQKLEERGVQETQLPRVKNIIVLTERIIRREVKDSDVTLLRRELPELLKDKNDLRIAQKIAATLKA